MAGKHMSDSNSSDESLSFDAFKRDIETCKHVAFVFDTDVTRVAYLQNLPTTRTTSDKTIEVCEKKLSRLRLSQFATSDFDENLEELIRLIIRRRLKVVMSIARTFNYYPPSFTELLRLRIKQVSHTDCLVKGFNFLLKNIHDETFTYQPENKLSEYSFDSVGPSLQYPYLLIEFGYFLTFCLVKSQHTYHKIDVEKYVDSSYEFKNYPGKIGSVTFEEFLNELNSGRCELDSQQLASSSDSSMLDDFRYTEGPVAYFVEQMIEDPNYSPKRIWDVIFKTCVYLAHEAADLLRKYKAHRVYFCGNFLISNSSAMRAVMLAVKYWSENRIQARFLRHYRYASVIGAILNRNEPHERDSVSKIFESSWKEHYPGSYSFDYFYNFELVPREFQEIGVFEMECCGSYLTSFPLLKDVNTYEPDTVLLNTEENARIYWITCMEDAINKTVQKAIESQDGCVDSEERAQEVKNKVLKYLKIFKSKPFAYGRCTVRTLLDLREQILNQYKFDDAYLNQKRAENKIALSNLPFLVEKLDGIENERLRHTEVIKGFLAGNMYDWGARDVVNLMESESGLSFQSAIDSLQARPWLIDNLDAWLDQFGSKTYQCALIFVDNSGTDLILGVLPFVREFVKKKIKVLLACNLSPALNDVTLNELDDVLEKASAVDRLLKEAVDGRKIITCSTGQGSPCLDLRRVDSTLCAILVKEKVDLVVLEGMGRAIHTNFNAQFTCDSVKAAVVKNSWLADRLGGGIFSVIFSFQKCS